MQILVLYLVGLYKHAFEEGTHWREQFSNIGPKLADNIEKGNRSYVDYLSDYNIDASFQLKETDSSTVSILLSKLSKSKATGLGKISCRLLRECPDLIAESLSLIFNCSIITGIFPNEWKCAKVVPIHKQGKRNCVDNYRPISIIPAVAKVFERLIYDQVFQYITEKKILINCQSGFRGQHSTVTSLLEATNEWAYNIDHGNVNAVMFLELKKAFDTVDHEILLGKLNAYGISGMAGNCLDHISVNVSKRVLLMGVRLIVALFDAEFLKGLYWGHSYF